MADGCFNAIRIDGERENLEKVLNFLKKAEVKGKFFDLLYPIPDELRTEEERFGDEWRADNWGTQLDIHVEAANVHKVTDNTILLTLVTEWSPPVAFFAKFARDFHVDMEIRYIADKNIFIGKAICKDGKQVSNELIEKPTTEELKRPDLDFSKII